MIRYLSYILGILAILPTIELTANDVPLIANSEVEGQPLGANAQRLIDTLEFLGAPLSEQTVSALTLASKQRDAAAIQKALDSQVLFVVSLNPEVRVKVARGPAEAVLQQRGYTPVIVKVINDSTVTRQLRIKSRQAGAVYAGTSLPILQRQAQTELKQDENTGGETDRFMQLEMYQSQPMTRSLSGLKVEYALALIYCHEAGKREATIAFDVGSGTQDIGFRGELPVLFNVRPAREVKLSVRDVDGSPTTARFEFRDQRGRVYPPLAKRLAPDFFFQPQIYRRHGDTVLLPPGKFAMRYSRGPEYRVLEREIEISESGSPAIEVKLQRWIDPMRFGYYCGDHHIHGAGCSHYTAPTKGVRPEDMFLQVKGEGLNVGCVLTWGPCFEFQRQYFSPIAHAVSEPLTVLKYDLEISGFGSAALGHVCLLNLKDQTYPQTAGSKTQGWPTWTVPVMRWCKEQGGVTGYPHSAMHVNPSSAAQRLLDEYDNNDDAGLDTNEAEQALLPIPFANIDTDGDSKLTDHELKEAIDKAADQLPNLAVPEMNGAGAMEICVSTAEGVCDFISAMDTARVPEWNTWYHILNCGYPLKLSGETDFPCMSSRRVGQGRVYVQLGDIDRLDFTDWCNAIAKGRSYVSDGFAHALKLTVNGIAPGFGSVKLPTAGDVTVVASVSFAPEIPKAVAYGTLEPGAGRRMVGDTINLHAPRSSDVIRGGNRLVEIVMNGSVVAKRQVPADGKIHQLEFTVPVKQSSWIALRQFPQLHTNSVDVIIADKPIRASAKSARWCIETIKLLWKNRHRHISDAERPTAHDTYQKAIATYERIAAESLNR